MTLGMNPANTTEIKHRLIRGAQQSRSTSSSLVTAVVVTVVRVVIGSSSCNSSNDI